MLIKLLYSLYIGKNRKCNYGNMYFLVLYASSIKIHLRIGSHGIHFKEASTCRRNRHR